MELCWSTLLWDAYRHWSGYLAVSVIVVVGSVLLAWLYEKRSIRKFLHKRKKQNLKGEEITLVDEYEGAKTNQTEEWNEDGSALLNPRILAEIVEAEMTPEQKDHERAVEREQLAAILKLLQEQEDKFQVSSMQQLEEQLHLYR